MTIQSHTMFQLGLQDSADGHSEGPRHCPACYLLNVCSAGQLGVSAPESWNGAAFSDTRVVAEGCDVSFYLGGSCVIGMLMFIGGYDCDWSL